MSTLFKGISVQDFELNIDIPKAYQFLLKAARYKCTYGGRGAARSWSYARVMILRALQAKTRICCFREIQKSIKESIHKLLKDQIELMNLSRYFVITDHSIIGSNGSEFIFESLKSNVAKIKSLEGIDIADVEEAESVSEESWQVLLPTIRKEGSEIWLRFNTKYADDATYQRFVVRPPENCVTVKTSYLDNPYFPSTLELERQQDLAFRPHEYKNIWLGDPIGIGRRVWPDFDKKIHVKEFPWKTVQETGNCFMAIDPASHYYPACVWVALFPKPQTKDLCKWIYAEYPQVNDLGDYFHKLRTRILYTGSLADLAREIYAHDGQGVKIVKRAIDSRFAKGSGSGSFVNNSQGMVQEMAKKANGGLSFAMPLETTIDTMRSRITADLQWNVLQPFNASNCPNIYVAPWCTNTIEAMQNHRLEEDSEAEDARYKDFSDAIRICYAGMDGHKYRDPRQQQAPVFGNQNQESRYYESVNQSVGWMG
jgi:uncharacterized protein YfiM (DUF2279 family)